MVLQIRQAGSLAEPLVSDSYFFTILKALHKLAFVRTDLKELNIEYSCHSTVFVNQIPVFVNNGTTLLTKNNCLHLKLTELRNSLRIWHNFDFKETLI